MTAAEFEAQRATLACRACGHVGLDPYPQPNGNGLGAQCPACESKTPLIGVMWFPQGGSRQALWHTRKDYSPREVWRAAGDHCTFCGKSWALCEQLNIGRTAQHIHPVLFGGQDTSPLVPFCARCQEMSRAALMETRDVMEYVTELEQIIRRIEAANPELNIIR